MERETNNDQPQQPGAVSTENYTNERKETFNELSELSLEERMAVADQIGIPVNNVSDAAATGAMSGDNAAEGSQNSMEENLTGGTTDR